MSTTGGCTQGPKVPFVSNTDSVRVTEHFAFLVDNVPVPTDDVDALKVGPADAAATSSLILGIPKTVTKSLRCKPAPTVATVATLNAVPGACGWRASSTLAACTPTMTVKWARRVEPLRGPAVLCLPRRRRRLRQPDDQVQVRFLPLSIRRVRLHYGVGHGRHLRRQ
jgi:hypothetical protein